jgi:hypothetical protein
LRMTEALAERVISPHVWCATSRFEVDSMTEDLCPFLRQSSANRKNSKHS